MADLGGDPAALRVEQQDAARQLTGRVALVAMAVAMTDHDLAAALRHCAQARPHRRTALLALSDQARAHGGRQWQLYAKWRALAGTGEVASTSSPGRGSGRERRRAAKSLSA